MKNIFIFLALAFVFFAKGLESHIVADIGPRPFKSLLGNVDQHHAKSALRKILRHPTAHDASANDADEITFQF
jgi:hypothetical protein